MHICLVLGVFGVYLSTAATENKKAPSSVSEFTAALEESRRDSVTCRLQTTSLDSLRNEIDNQPTAATGGKILQTLKQYKGLPLGSEEFLTKIKTTNIDIMSSQEIEQVAALSETLENCQSGSGTLFLDAPNFISRKGTVSEKKEFAKLAIALFKAEQKRTIPLFHFMLHLRALVNMAEQELIDKKYLNLLMKIDTEIKKEERQMRPQVQQTMKGDKPKLRLELLKRELAIVERFQKRLSDDVLSKLVP